MVAWRLHVTVGTSPRLDFLEFFRSVVGSWLKTVSFASSDPNERIIMNTNVGLHHLANAETRSVPLIS